MGQTCWRGGRAHQLQPGRVRSMPRETGVTWCQRVREGPRGVRPRLGIKVGDQMWRWDGILISMWALVGRRRWRGWWRKWSDVAMVFSA